jgi:TRAP-type mannitol/chloroaromatic compound transport system substrate-binding protein
MIGADPVQQPAAGRRPPKDRTGGDRMKRRTFIKAGGAGLAVSAIAAPAVAQSQPELNWRLAASWPKSLDTIYGAAQHFANRVAECTDNKFQIRTFAAGEIVPGLQVLDAVQNNTVEMGHTASYYYVGKDPTFSFDCTVPFGMNKRQQDAWMLHGGGMELLRDFFKGYNIYNIPAANTGAQMGGWYSKEIKTVEDLNGLKFRIAGLAGNILAKLGVVPQVIAGGDIYPALEKGTIDAAEWVGPYDDEKLGFYKIAKYYYYPGWWEGNAQLSLYVNLEHWQSLPKSYQAIVTAAAYEANIWCTAKYDTDNVAALKRLVANGTELRPFSREILDACYKAAQQFYAETTAKNANFKKIYDPWKNFLEDEHQWFRVEELQFDNYMMSRHS